MTFEVTYVNPYKPEEKKATVEAVRAFNRPGQTVVFEDGTGTIAIFNNVLCVKKVEE